MCSGSLKKQSTVETSVFSAKFVTMKQNIEASRGLRYKLRMVGIPKSSPSYIYGDNISVVNNIFRLESVLRKKSISACFHTVHKSVDMDKSLVGCILGNENVTDLMRKVLFGQRGKHLVSNILYDTHDDH